MLFVFIFLALCLIIGSAMILLRTANIPGIPKHLKAKPYKDDDEND